MQTHQAAYASRLLCGACSREQPLSKSGCRFCKQSFVPRSTAHWEGGKGTRDTSKMARNDRKKHANSDKKTKSKKSERVGKQ
jgi:hypothetical protein